MELIRIMSFIHFFLNHELKFIEDLIYLVLSWVVIIIRTNQDNI